MITALIYGNDFVGYIGLATFGVSSIAFILVATLYKVRRNT
jgi:hypothetical protein